MKCISLVCMLCLLHLASAVCECGNGQQSFIPSMAIFNSPSSFNGTDSSLSSFGSTCVEQGSLYHCNDNTDNPLFDCNASNNSYYEWDSVLSVSITFGKFFHSMNILVTFLISTSSNVSAPASLQYAAFDQNGTADPIIPLLTNLPEGPYQHNYTLSPDEMFNGVLITITPSNTSQWVAINRIIFCPVDQSSSTMSLSTSLSTPVTTSSMSTPDQTVTSSVLPTTTFLSMASTVSPTMSSTVSPTMSSTVSPILSAMSPIVSTMSPSVSPTVSAMSPIVSTVSAMSPIVSTVSPSVSATVNTTNVGASSDSEDDTLPLALLVAVVAIAIFLFIVVLVLGIVLCFICRKKSHSDTYAMETAPQVVTVVPEGYEMLTADTLPSSMTNGVTNALKKNDYDYPQLPLEIENNNHVDDPCYSTPEQYKKNKPNTKGSSSTLPATFARSDIDIALYETPSIAPASSKASFNKVIENGEPVYYMLDKKYSFYEKSKSLNALEEVDLQPYSSIYDDPQPLTKSEAPSYVKPSDIKEIKLLGDGQFGEVYLAEVVGLSPNVFDGVDPSNGPLQVAIKRLRGNPSEGMRQAFEKEIKFMSRLKHKHVIRLLGICTDANQPFLMIEYAINGDLNRYLKSLKLAEGNLPPNKREITKLGLLSQCTQVASGMEYLSSLNFIHRDLATRNILVGDWNQVKIADFGMSQNLYDSDYYRVKGHAIVPIRWMATECFYGRFSVKTDVWAFGVVVWEVFTMCSQRPYEEMTDPELIQNARYAEKRKLLDQTEHCPDKVYQLLLQCWKSTPAERPNFSQLYDRFTKLSNGSI